MLAFVVIISSLLLLLGSFLMNMSVTESMIASNQDRGIQAHYLAESGAEAALGVLLGDDPGFRGSLAAPLGAGDFEASASEFADDRGGRWIRISSRGNAGNISRKIVLEFLVVPGTPLDVINGALRGCLDEESGEIQDGLQADFEEAIKFVSLSSGNGTWLAEESSSSFSAPSFFFEGVPALENYGSLTLAAEEIVILGEIVLGENALLTLQPRDENALRLYLEEPIRGVNFSILVERGVYSFTEPFSLAGSTSLKAMEVFQTASLVPGSEQWFFPTQK